MVTHRLPPYDQGVPQHVWPAAIAAGCTLSAVLVVGLTGSANLNVMLAVAIVVPLAIIGVLELPKLFRRHFGGKAQPH